MYLVCPIHIKTHILYNIKKKLKIKNVPGSYIKLCTASGRQLVRGRLLLGDRPRLAAARLLLLLLLLLVLKTLFQLQQLTHKVEVGRYDRPSCFDHFVRVHHGHFPVAHHVSDGYGRRPGDAGLTVDQNASAGFSRVFCKNTKNTNAISCVRHLFQTRVHCTMFSSFWEREPTKRTCTYGTLPPTRSGL